MGYLLVYRCERNFYAVLLCGCAFNYSFVVSNKMFCIQMEGPGAGRVRRLVGAVLAMFLRVDKNLEARIGSFLDRCTIPIVTVLLVINMNVNIIVGCSGVVSHSKRNAHGRNVIGLL